MVEQANTMARIYHDLAMAQIDLANAFGSISHLVILAALTEAKAGPKFIEIVMGLHEDTTTEFIADDGAH